MKYGYNAHIDHPSIGKVVLRPPKYQNTITGHPSINQVSLISIAAKKTCQMTEMSS